MDFTDIPAPYTTSNVKEKTDGMWYVEAHIAYELEKKLELARDTLARINATQCLLPQVHDRIKEVLNTTKL